MQIKSLAVFCGSKNGVNPQFVKQAEALGNILAAKEVMLVYGGGNKGLMGAVSNAALKNNGKVTGIIPYILKDIEQHHDGLTELIIVDDMHTRKKMMYEKCDAAIILPGGYGTMDEFFELLTWNQLNIHNKKIFILNVDGFYNHLLAHAAMMETEKFLYDKIENKLIVLTTVSELNNFL